MATQQASGNGAADLVLIPAKPSPLDVWAASEIVAAVQARQKTAKGMPKAAFVITMAQPRTPLRVAYPNAISEGNSVVDGRDQTARNKILAIIGELKSLTHDN